MKKLGFTMVELLLCIAIIGVVSAMGMTITKKSTDRAYDLYFYNGYINLYNSIADIIAEGGAATDINALNARLGTEETLPADNIIRTINGVTYEIDASNNIKMTVPQKKTRTNSGRATVLFGYIAEGDGYLVPLISGSDVDLQNRRDLLPAYVDNGIVGRVKPNASGNYTIDKQIAYYSYRQAYCSITGNSSINIGTEEEPNFILECPAIGGLTNQNGILKVANPSKAR